MYLNEREGKNTHVSVFHIDILYQIDMYLQQMHIEANYISKTRRNTSGKQV